MPHLPLVIGSLLTLIVRFPLALVVAVLFVLALHRLANRCRCYGLPRNLLFGAVCGALALALVQAAALLGRNGGLRLLLLAQLAAGYETAVAFTVVWRLVFAQRPPRPPSSPDEGAA